MMAVCDDLAAALASVQEGRGRLLESLLCEALEGSRVERLVGAAR